MNSNKVQNEQLRTTRWLRQADQACVAAVLIFTLVMMAVYWIYRGGHRGQLIHIERADPRINKFRIDINQAHWPEFTLLPGVGETLARRIVEFRERQGKFVSHDQLLNVDGIGPNTLDKIRPFLLPINQSPSLVTSD